jgi:hypothetical protein
MDRLSPLAVSSLPGMPPDFHPRFAISLEHAKRWDNLCRSRNGIMIPARRGLIVGRMELVRREHAFFDIMPHCGRLETWKALS